MLIRCIRRFRTAFADADPQALYDAEFADRLGNPELELSVYSVTKDQWIAACMCHHAAGGSDPPRFARAVDVSCVRQDATPEAVEDCPFGVLTVTHHVLKFVDEPQLKQFVQDLLQAVLAGTATVLDAEATELKSWLRSQRRAGDAEWSSFLEGREKWTKWSGADSVPPPPGVP